MRLLVIEDEYRLADTLRDLFAANNYAVDVCNDGESGLNAASSGVYDVIILDVMLPKLSGLEIISNLRQNDIKTPVLLLTAKTEVSDRINGLDCGADYYLTKPFDTNELLACVRSLLRRQREGLSENISFGDLCLNIPTCTIVCDERKIRLSSKEFDIMRLLILNGSRIISKENIINKVWGQDSVAADNHVEVYISFLSKKIALIDSSVVISTVRKVGYHLEVKNDA